MEDRLLAQLASGLDALDLRYEAKPGLVHLGFGEGVQWLGMTFNADQWSENGVSLRVRAYMPLVRSVRRSAFLAPPAWIAETVTLCNLFNALHLRAGSLWMDPSDGDLTFSWSVPVGRELPLDHLDHIIRMAHVLMHVRPDFDLLVTGGTNAADAFARHEERDATGHTARDAAEADDASGHVSDARSGEAGDEEDGQPPLRWVA